jgi:type I restriction enzyme R subunit
VAFSEADTRAKLIDPAIHACGWSEDMICRETTLGAVEIIARQSAPPVWRTHRLYAPDSREH